ncbi:MAG TPA: hypothetical protein PLE82_01920 [Saccharofermentans sp.]|nr:hypothetical protein [Saccharofermentans sp.]
MAYSKGLFREVGKRNLLKFFSILACIVVFIVGLGRPVSAEPSVSVDLKDEWPDGANFYVTVSGGSNYDSLTVDITFNCNLTSVSGWSGSATSNGNKVTFVINDRWVLDGGKTGISVWTENSSESITAASFSIVSSTATVPSNTQTQPTPPANNPPPPPPGQQPPAQQPGGNRPARPGAGNTPGATATPQETTAATTVPTTVATAVATTAPAQATEPSSIATTTTTTTTTNTANDNVATSTTETTAPVDSIDSTVDPNATEETLVEESGSVIVAGVALNAPDEVNPSNSSNSGETEGAVTRRTSGDSLSIAPGVKKESNGPLIISIIFLLFASFVAYRFIKLKTEGIYGAELALQIFFIGDIIEKVTGKNIFAQPKAETNAQVEVINGYLKKSDTAPIRPVYSNQAVLSKQRAQISPRTPGKSSNIAMASTTAVVAVRKEESISTGPKPVEKHTFDRPASTSVSNADALARKEAALMRRPAAPQATTSTIVKPESPKVQEQKAEAPKASTSVPVQQREPIKRPASLSANRAQAYAKKPEAPDAPKATTSSVPLQQRAPIKRPASLSANRAQAYARKPEPPLTPEIKPSNKMPIQQRAPIKRPKSASVNHAQNGNSNGNTVT